MTKLYLDLVSKLPIWVLIGVSGAMVIMGDFCGKLWSQNLKTIWFWTAVITYALSGLLYLPVLLRGSLSATSVIWSLVSIIGYLFIGLVLFKEQLNPWQIVGLILGVASLVIFAFN